MTPRQRTHKLAYNPAHPANAERTPERCNTFLLDYSHSPS